MLACAEEMHIICFARGTCMSLLTFTQKKKPLPTKSKDLFITTFKFDQVYLPVMIFF